MREAPLLLSSVVHVSVWIPHIRTNACFLYTSLVETATCASSATRNIPPSQWYGGAPQAKRNLCLNSNDINVNKTMRPSPAETACLQRPPYRRWRVAHHTQLRNTSARTARNTTKRRDSTNLEPFARKCTTHAAPRCHWRRPLTPIPFLRFYQKLRHFWHIAPYNALCNPISLPRRFPMFTQGDIKTRHGRSQYMEIPTV